MVNVSRFLHWFRFGSERSWRGFFFAKRTTFHCANGQYENSNLVLLLLPSYDKQGAPYILQWNHILSKLNWLPKPELMRKRDVIGLIFLH